MFRKLGTKIDNFIVDVGYWLGDWHRARFWYKIYAYFFFIKRRKKDHYVRALERTYEQGYLYKWQYKRLKKLNKNRRVAGTTSPKCENEN